MTSVRQLAGLRFETVAPPSADVLPRMDIAAFVGFAAAGPLDLPVSVEDIPQFEEIFGADIAIASDPENHRTLHGYLAPCVRAFFRNGGKRCWVIRVANRRAPNRFAIAGLGELGAANSLTPAYAWARSQGSWSDSLRVSAAAVRETIPLSFVSFSPLEIRIAPVSGGTVIPGDLLRIVGETRVLWVVVELATALGSSPMSSLNPGSGAVVRITPGATYLQPVESPLSSPLGGPPPFAERVTMDLTVRDSGGNRWTFSGLGFAPKHPRYWAALPDDLSTFTAVPPASDPAGIYRSLWNAALTPRFPLAGPGGKTVYIPATLPISAPVESSADPRTETPLERDGIDDFGARLFLDKAFDEVLTADLLAQAEFVQYQSDRPRALTGIHAALAIEEATLIAAPDALHRGWMRGDEPALASPLASSPIDRPDWWTFLDCTKAAPRPRVSDPPGYGFLACDLPRVRAPILTHTPPTGDGAFDLIWNADQNAVDTLEEATDPLFASAEAIYTGPAARFAITGHPPGDYFYRVQRRAATAISDYSNPVAVRVEPALGWRVQPEDRYDDRVLLDVQRALVRMCSARGDIFAVLGMPEHYREQQALAHAARLKAPDAIGGLILPLGFGEASAFSFGALYHPWLTAREENAFDELRTNPPEGAMAGVFAQRAATRGAWIAPANEPLRGVVALSPPLSRDSWQSFLDAQINLIRQEPQAFLTLAGDTLLDDDDYRPINVRRLLSLLRRLVLRKGAEYVFEPNGDEFRRLVQRGFESLLEGMFLRGAFAGRVASTAFQVVTDPSVNTPASVERGRFITELRVAPSRPLNFLTIRLVQTADRSSLTEGK